MSKCSFCDGPGGKLTYKCQSVHEHGGKTYCVDWCISNLVRSLNFAGLTTVASCCGHGRKDGQITLKDGREIVIKLPPKDKGKADE